MMAPGLLKADDALRTINRTASVEAIKHSTAPPTFLSLPNITKARLTEMRQYISLLLENEGKAAGAPPLYSFSSSSQFQGNAVLGSAGKLLAQLPSKPKSNKRAFQRLPKQQRRRAMSYNPFRIPKRYRDPVIRDMLLHPPRDSRRVRKDRRRPRFLLKEYTRRSNKRRWLATHIWHAKRFYMVELWGYKLAFSPYERCQRKLYRQAARKCVIHDRSYVEVIELIGAVASIKAVLSCFNPNLGLLFGSRYLSGCLRGETPFYYPVSSSYTNAEVSNIDTLPVPEQKQDTHHSGLREKSSIPILLGNVQFLWKAEGSTVCPSTMVEFEGRDGGRAAKNGCFLEGKSVSSTWKCEDASFSASSSSNSASLKSFILPSSAPSHLIASSPHFPSSSSSSHLPTSSPDLPSSASSHTSSASSVVFSSLSLSLASSSAPSSSPTSLTEATPHSHTLWLWVHPSFKKELYSLLLAVRERLVNTQKVVNFQLNTISGLAYLQTFGPRSLDLLLHTLNVDTHTQHGGNRIWQSLRGAMNSSASLPSNAVVALEVKIPTLLGPMSQQYVQGRRRMDVRLNQRKGEPLSFSLKDWSPETAVSRIFQEISKRGDEDTNFPSKAGGEMLFPPPSSSSSMLNEAQNTHYIPVQRSRKRQNVRRIMDRLKRQSDRCFSLEFSAEQMREMRALNASEIENGGANRKRAFISQGAANELEEDFGVVMERGECADSLTAPECYEIPISAEEAPPLYKEEEGKKKHEKEEPTFPLLLIYRNDLKPGFSSSGFDLILPLHRNITNLWTLLHSNGALALGLQDRRKLLLEAETLDFPYDYPETSVGFKMLISRAAESALSHSKKPKAKRINFKVSRIPYPFMFDWEAFLRLPHRERESPCLKKEEIVRPPSALWLDTRNLLGGSASEFLAILKESLRGVAEGRKLNPLTEKRGVEKEYSQKMDSGDFSRFESTMIHVRVYAQNRSIPRENCHLYEFSKEDYTGFFKAIPPGDVMRGYTSVSKETPKKASSFSSLFNGSYTSKRPSGSSTPSLLLVEPRLKEVRMLHSSAYSDKSRKAHNPSFALVNPLLSDDEDFITFPGNLKKSPSSDAITELARVIKLEEEEEEEGGGGGEEEVANQEEKEGAEANDAGGGKRVSVHPFFSDTLKNAFSFSLEEKAAHKRVLAYQAVVTGNAVYLVNSEVASLRMLAGVVTSGR